MGIGTISCPKSKIRKMVYYVNSKRNYLRTSTLKKWSEKIIIIGHFQKLHISEDKIATVDPMVRLLLYLPFFRASEVRK